MQGNRTPFAGMKPAPLASAENPGSRALPLPSPEQRTSGTWPMEAPIYRAGPARAASVVAVQHGQHEPLPQNA